MEKIKHTTYDVEETIELLCRYKDIQDFVFQPCVQFQQKYEELYGCKPIIKRAKTVEEAKNDWFMPKEYQEIDVLKFVLDKCKNTEEADRVKYEFEEYKSRDLLNLLRFLIYFVDYLRKNNHVWGVGRGSSVSSYILFLIGIHKVNSIKYNLDISEFLK